MIEKFTTQQQTAIEEKIDILMKVKKEKIAPAEAAREITERRLAWLSDNRHLLRTDLPLPEAAYRLLRYDHMKVTEGIRMEMITGSLLRVECRNFCPYLEAAQRLNLGVRFVCEEIVEPSLKAFLQKINPQLHFRRDYRCIRPSSDYCLEEVELR